MKNLKSTELMSITQQLGNETIKTVSGNTHRNSVSGNVEQKIK